MAQRSMTISIIGCLNNCIREYQEKMHDMRCLLNSVKDDIGDEIIEHLADGIVETTNVDEVIEDFFDNDHGMIKIGSLLIQDLQRAKWGEFDKMEILKVDTDEVKAQLKHVVDILN